VVVLHETPRSQWFAGGLQFKLRLVEAFQKKPRFVAEHFGFDDHDIGDASRE
jgi:hypothetical protein